MSKFLRSFLSLVLFILAMHAVSHAALKPLQKTVDSLFTIASSGEIRFQAMVQPAIDSIAAMGGAAVPFLTPKLGTSSARERLTVINILKKIGSPAIPDLTVVLRGKIGLASERAANALGEIGDSSAKEVLIESITHTRWQVREEAVGALGKLKTTSVSDAIQSAFADSVGQVRKSAAVAVGRLKLKGLLPNLISQLDDPFYGARMATRGSLLQLDTADVIASLIPVVQSERMLAREHAIFLLGQLKHPSANTALSSALKAAESSTRSAAAIALWNSGSTTAQNEVIAFLASEPDSLAKIRVRSVIPTATGK